MPLGGVFTGFGEIKSLPQSPGRPGSRKAPSNAEFKPFADGAFLLK
jgi:hypothetical protein